ncbi:MAG: sigma-54-dependent Fis family transcriptional regulator [Nitrospirae bacterium]|nr:MAG: sigma-54-dependent Fis family transcriptional regulator [Nitrospirota bacterium]
MAGSSTDNSLPHDQVLLAARIEGLTLLADYLTEPVAIFDPTLRLVYANAPAQEWADACPLFRRMQEDAGSSSLAKPCDNCPCQHVFAVRNPLLRESGDPCLEQGDACPFPVVFSLSQEEDKRPGYVVVMGQTGRDSRVWTKQEGMPHDEKAPPDRPRPSALEQLIGQSPAMQQLLEMIQLVAASEATVLIQGESGTGKELVARTIHQLSARRDHPFVVVECSSLPETLLESELFGHVRGSFTGAVADRKGLFEAAEGGTIFLDEIAETSLSFQAKLLRVLQEGEVRPVGSNQAVKVNVRILSASNKSLLDLVQAKAFRPDLYYRLAVLPLDIPPLRERREDVLLLAEQFLTRSCRRHHKPRVRLTADAQNALLCYSWPGNVRELENLIERVVVTARQPLITAQDLFGPSSDKRGENRTADLGSVGRAAREQAERKRILEALREANGEKSRAAKILNISRSSLYNKLRRLQITEYRSPSSPTPRW